MTTGTVRIPEVVAVPVASPEEIPARLPEDEPHILWHFETGLYESILGENGLPERVDWFDIIG